MLEAVLKVLTEGERRECWKGWPGWVRCCCDCGFWPWCEAYMVEDGRELGWP